MPIIVSDIVDAYIFRKNHARVQFLLLMRRSDTALGSTWQGIHEKVEPGETALNAAVNAATRATGLPIVDTYSVDFVNPVYDSTRDAVVMAPVFAFTVPPRARIELSEEFGDYAWCEKEEATARMIWSGQRWAIRHIDEVIGLGGPDAEFYRV